MAACARHRARRLEPDAEQHSLAPLTSTNGLKCITVNVCCKIAAYPAAMRRARGATASTCCTGTRSPRQQRLASHKQYSSYVSIKRLVNVKSGQLSGPTAMS